MTDTQLRLQPIIERCGTKPAALIPILQAAQEELGYLPRESLTAVAEALRLPLSKVYGVVTFYSQFHLKPRGKYVVRVCLGTACHVRGGEAILGAVSRKLGIGAGETTEDLMFTIERVACLGACGLAPVLMVNDATHGRLTPRKAERLIDKLRNN